MRRYLPPICETNFRCPSPLHICHPYLPPIYRWQICNREGHLKFGSAGPIFWANFAGNQAPKAHFGPIFLAVGHILGWFCRPSGTQGTFGADFVGHCAHFVLFLLAIGHLGFFGSDFACNRAPMHIFGPILLAIGHFGLFSGEIMTRRSASEARRKRVGSPPEARR